MVTVDDQDLIINNIKKVHNLFCRCTMGRKVYGFPFDSGNSSVYFNWTSNLVWVVIYFVVNRFVDSVTGSQIRHLIVYYSNREIFSEHFSFFLNIIFLFFVWLRKSWIVKSYQFCWRVTWWPLLFWCFLICVNTLRKILVKNENLEHTV